MNEEVLGDLAQLNSSLVSVVQNLAAVEAKAKAAAAELAKVPQV